MAAAAAAPPFQPFTCSPPPGSGLPSAARRSSLQRPLDGSKRPLPALPPSLAACRRRDRTPDCSLHDFVLHKGRSRLEWQGEQHRAVAAPPSRLNKPYILCRIVGQFTTDGNVQYTD